MFFRQASQGAAPGEAYTRPPSLGPVGSSVPALVHAQPSAVAPSTPATEKLIEDHLSVQTIIRAYQVCFGLIRSLIKLDQDRGVEKQTKLVLANDHNVFVH